jgi:hypothetical protein
MHGSQLIGSHSTFHFAIAAGFRDFVAFILVPLHAGCFGHSQEQDPKAQELKKAHRKAPTRL